MPVWSIWPWEDDIVDGEIVEHFVTAEDLLRLRSFLTIRAEAEEMTKMDLGGGLLPLHWVAGLAKKEGPHVLPFFVALFNAHPAAAEAKQCDGWLLLHLVARHWFSSPAEGLQAMQMLLAAHPAAAEAKNSAGWLPLHIVAFYWSSSPSEGLQAMQMLLAAHPAAAEVKKSDGWLPLHQVARCWGGSPFAEKALHLLLSLFPAATAEGDNNGFLPIHELCCNESGAATVKMAELLLAANPATVAMKDGKNGLTPSRFAAALKKLPAAVISYLQRAEAGKTTTGRKGKMEGVASRQSLRLTVETGKGRGARRRRKGEERREEAL